VVLREQEGGEVVVAVCEVVGSARLLFLDDVKSVTRHKALAFLSVL
jgi:hypothetical protein